VTELIGSSFQRRMASDVRQKIMKRIPTLIFLFVSIFSSICSADEAAPTDLTVVVCDSANKVLDTVVIPNDKKSWSVKFTLPKGLDEIRVFALGKRQHKDLPSGYYITGRPDDKKWMGLGYVEAHIEDGILVGVDGNGFGQFKIGEKLQTQILANIKAGKRASMTILEKNGEQDGGGKGE